jgi:hypothetical protein
LETKFALIEAEGAERVNTQVPAPLQAPAQPEKAFPSPGSALSVTLDPWVKVPLQVTFVQDKLAGWLVTFPPPLIKTESTLSGPGIVKDTSGLGELSLPFELYAVIEK